MPISNPDFLTRFEIIDTGYRTYSISERFFGHCMKRAPYSKYAERNMHNLLSLASCCTQFSRHGAILLRWFLLMYRFYLSKPGHPTVPFPDCAPGRRLFRCWCRHSRSASSKIRVQLPARQTATVSPRFWFREITQHERGKHKTTIGITV
jgi:hypothetical protein